MAAPDTATQGADSAIVNRVERLEQERIWFLKLIYRAAKEFIKYCDSNYNFSKSLTN